MRTSTLLHTWKSLVTLTALSAATAAPAAAMSTTWYVMNYGSDAYNSPSCGSKLFPCRSISKAIGLAATGDTILVGPGVYGDLDGNGVFDPPPSGDEAAEIGSGCECMIKVNKQLTIVSRDGAEVTTLDGSGLTQSVVDIQMGYAVFGKPSKGFMIRSGSVSGLLVDPTATFVSIAGNIATSNPTGFDVAVNGSIGKPLLTDNVAAENSGTGISLHGDYTSLQRNRAVSNGGAGFQIAGTGHNLKQNVAVQNNYGFQVDMTPPLGHPFANCTGNPNCFGFTTNTAIGNTTAGIFVDATAAVGGPAYLQKSNSYGNGDPANNCGAAVDNQVAGPTWGASFDKFYWGAATGVGPNPADTAGGACLTGAGSGSVFLFSGSPAAKEYAVGEKPLK